MIFFELFYTFFLIGIMTFGGGYAMIPMIQDSVVGHGWMTLSELTDFIGNYDEYREQKARSNPFSGPGGGTGPSKSGGPQKVLRRVQDSSRRP